MASIILSNVGTSIGNSLLPGIGGRILSSFGRRAGRAIDNEIGLTPSGSHEGPRLENLHVQDSRYGIGIPVAFGRVRVAGNIIWVSDLIETAHENQTFGGKGGIVRSALGGSSRTTYSYSLHCAVAISAGEIGGIETIWADSKVIYQNGVWQDGVVGSATLYTGSAGQTVDPLLESMIGTGLVPAYRGVAYMVLESLQLGNFGNRLPNLTFEIAPPVTSSQPEWLGNVDSGINHLPITVRNNGMPPIVIEGSRTRARHMLIGGFQISGSNATFNVVEFDVTGTEPFELANAQSANFGIFDLGDHAWALAPDNRYVAMYIQNIGASPTHRLVIYDVVARQFGDVLTIDLAFSADLKQLAWIDVQHFAIIDASGGRRGLRIFARAGTGIIDLGFFDVWGVGSTGTTAPLFYAQFTPIANGLLHYMADTSPNFTAIYVRSLVWQNNALVVGSPYTLTSGYSTGVGSGAMATLLRTDEDEWTLFYRTVIDMQLLSFRPGLTSATITRPWQTLTNSSFSVGSSTPAVVYGDCIVAVQRSATDNYYRLTEITLNSSNYSLTLDGDIIGGYSTPSFDFGLSIIDATKLLLLGTTGSDHELTQVGIVHRRETGDTLDHIVAGILDRAGYESSDYDVTDLAAVTVDGYLMPEPMTAAGALEPLQVFEPFDLVDSDGQLKATRHSNNAGVAISDSETAADDKGNSSREQTRTQELDLPIEVTVDYLDASRDYETGSQRARRMATRGARTMGKLALPIVCTAQRAKQIAEARLFNAWAERDRVRINWSRRWLAVEPGDVVDLGNRLLRVEDVKQSGGLLEVQGALVPEASVTSDAQADPGAAVAYSDITPFVSTLYLMDLPLLRAEDDQPGVYIAISGINGWPGGSLWRASDGVNFTGIANMATAATSGIATTSLANGAPYYMDNINSVNVQLLQGTLASCTEDELLNGANAVLLGDEIIQFQTATLIGSGLYTLSQLLRGRRGTEQGMATHAVGERFTLLTAGTVQFVPALLTDRDREYEFRALSNGQTLGDVTDTDFTYELRTLQPLAPTHIIGSRAGGTGTDLTIGWVRRARLHGDWVDNIDVPLDETSELYDVEIMNGGSVMRTFSNVTSTSQLYTAAQQTSDWGVVPASFTVNIYQISDRYGRGQQGQAVI